MLRPTLFSLALAMACHSQVIFQQDFEAAKIGTDLPGGVKDNSGWAGVRPTLEVADTGQPGRGKALEVQVPGFCQVALGNLSVKKSTTYRVQISLRALGDSPVTVYARRGPSPYTKLFGRDMVAHENWQDITFLAQCALDEPRTVLLLLCRANTTLWIDKFKIEEVDEKPQPQPPPLLGNLFHNSGFELGMEGWMKRGVVEVDTSVSHSGKASARMGPKGHLCTPWYPVGIGQVYTLSGWFRAEGGAAEPGISVSDWCHKEGGKTHRQVRLKLKPGIWQRLTMQWTVPFPSGISSETTRFYVNIYGRPPEGTTIWVDDLMFSYGPVTDYQPRRPSELAISSSAPYSAYTVEEPVTLQVKASGAVKTRTVQLVRLDEYDQVAGQTQVTLTDAETVVKLGTLPPGFWRFVTRSGLKADAVAEGELLVSVGPVMPDVPLEKWLVGSHIPSSERAVAACYKLGMRWNRLHDTGKEAKWSVVEPKQGEWNFRDDTITAKLVPGGALLANLDDLPAWVFGKKTRRSARIMSHPTGDTTHWENYIRQMVGHWKGQIHHWEVMNEPNLSRAKALPGFTPGSFYAHMLKAAHRAIKAADPNATVVGIGGCQVLGRSKWLEEIFAAGGLEACDAVAYHGYGTASWSTTTTPERLIERVGEWRALMRKYGRELPIWDTETGIQLAGSSRKFHIPGDTPPDIGAHLMPKAIATARAAGTQRLFFYSAHELTHAGSLGLNFILDFNNQMKAVGVPIAVAASLLEGTDFIEFTRPVPDAIQMTFSRGKQHIAVIWAGQGKHAIPRPFPADQGHRLVNCWGRDVGAAKDAVTATTEPIYVLSRGAE